MLKLFGRKKEVDPKAELKQALGEFSLPSFPAIILSALERVRDDDSAMSAIGDLVSSDPGLSVKLMTTVNSASYSLRHPLKSVHHAVSMLGRSELESILISMAVREALPRSNGRGFDLRRFWLTSARRAATARALAEKIDPSARSQSFTAALLQDMAMPVLSHRRGDEYGELLEVWHGGESDLVPEEQEKFGWDHAMVGTWMSAEWKFPTTLSDAIAAHHGTADEDVKGLPAVNLVATLREVDTEASVEQLVETTHDLYGVAKDDTVEIVEGSFSAAEEIAQLFG